MGQKEELLIEKRQRSTIIAQRLNVIRESALLLTTDTDKIKYKAEHAHYTYSESEIKASTIRKITTIRNMCCKLALSIKKLIEDKETPLQEDVYTENFAKLQKQRTELSNAEAAVRLLTM